MRTIPVDLAPAVVRSLRAALPEVAAETVAALRAEVAEYSPEVSGTKVTDVIQGAVELALGTFLTAVTERGLSSSELTPALGAAYDLGRGEARAGRTMEALLAAYRIGARVAWTRQSEVLVGQGVSAETTATFAQLVFAYIDELSGASVAGHRDELAVSGRVRDQLVERLAVGLLAGEPEGELLGRAKRAGWPIPATLTAVAVRGSQVASTSLVLAPETLRVGGDIAPGPLDDDHAVLLVPDAHRAALLSVLADRGAIVGPTRPWAEASVSFARVVQAMTILPAPGARPLDTDEHLVTLVVCSDAAALADLRTRALAPLAELRPAQAERLAETLRCWLLYQGRRDDVAAALQVHPQTVRYRMTQVRELFGTRLNDPEATFELIVALWPDRRD